MDGYLMIAVLGWGAGCVHVLAGPDHLVALAPLAAHRPATAVGVGLRWGLGHGIGAGLLGMLGLFSRDMLSLGVISEWSEFFVGLLLIGIAFWAFRLAGSDRETLRLDPAASRAGSGSMVGEDLGSGVGLAERHVRAPIWIGGLHGAAGTGHLLAVLPSLALPVDRATVYLVSYFLAAPVAMACVGGLLGRIARRLGPHRIPGLLYVSSGAAFVVGMIWISTAWPTG